MYYGRRIVADLISKYEMEYDVALSSLDYDTIQRVLEKNYRIN